MVVCSGIFTALTNRLHASGAPSPTFCFPGRYSATARSFPAGRHPSATQSTCSHPRRRRTNQLRNYLARRHQPCEAEFSGSRHRHFTFGRRRRMVCTSGFTAPSRLAGGQTPAPDALVSFSSASARQCSVVMRSLLPAHRGMTGARSASFQHSSAGRRGGARNPANHRFCAGVLPSCAIARNPGNLFSRLHIPTMTVLVIDAAVASSCGMTFTRTGQSARNDVTLCQHVEYSRSATTRATP